MKQKFFFVLLMILALAAIPAEAQFDALKKKVKDKTGTQNEKNPTENKTSENIPKRSFKDNAQNSEFLLMGKNDMEDDGIASLTACVQGADSRNYPPMSNNFKGWITAISEVAALRSFNNNTCQVIAFLILDEPAFKYRNIESLTETAQGHSLYKVENDKLVLVKKVEASQLYIVVVPQVAKADVKLTDLYLCGSPDTIKLFRRKTAGVVNCYDLKQSLYVFEKYKNYPSPTETNSVIFNAADFDSLNKQGKFKGLVIYKLVGEQLVPVK